MDRTARIARFHDALAERILIIDGAMGTMIQSYGLDEARVPRTRLPRAP